MSITLTEAELTKIGTRMLNDEFADMHREVMKLRRICAKHLCTCHKTLVLPLDPKAHKQDCTYRKEMS